MSESLNDSVTQWIHALKDGDAEAAAALWNRFFRRVVACAGVKMRNAERRAADEEDIAASVFESLWRGANERRFNDLQDRDDLWRLLAAITHQKSVDQLRFQLRRKRGAGRVRGDSAVALGESEVVGDRFDALPGDDLEPGFLVLMEEQYQRLLQQLRDDGLRRVALGRLEGSTNREIASQLGVTERAVERKLQLIRTKWERELAE